MDASHFLGVSAVLSILFVILAFLFACASGIWFGMFLSNYVASSQDDPNLNAQETPELERLGMH